ncbi:hypothetical protein T4D_5952 [Trichinella pseudospiralis]|uniref:CCHC-type domain-containing protein n=1 Tax=Trichinella pseudospiralis TaxID=6337 RepID=A0A0V1FLV5_TRIPS|nr:hypothetical protein T4D_5952 [Trichinella pseudospiralis]
MMTAAALDATSIFGPERFSDLVRLLRVTAWCRRFIDNASIPVGLRRVEMRLSIEELSDAERLLIRQSQIQAFGESDAARPHPMKSLKEINPFLDKFGILRVGGRLGWLIELLIRRENLRQLHAGVEQTHAALRERFWILRGRIHYSLGDPVLSLTFWSCEPDRMRDSDLWIVYGTQRNVEGQGLAERAAPQEPKTAEVEPNVRLPRLEVPKFDCDVTRFHEFWDQFETSVHRQHGASGATKLAYLRGCLTGAALDTIEGLSASNKGYELALQRLRERFDRPMVAVREQILWLVDLLMTKNKLSTVCDEFHKKVYALTALGKDPRTSDLSVAEVLIALCQEQLPGAAQFRWDALAQANSAVVADSPAFLRFLQQQTDLIGASRRSNEPTREGTKARRSGGERKRNSPESPPRGSATFLQAAVKRKCYICQKQHLPQQCPSLLRAGSRQRRELARRAPLCFACLEPGHYASGCKNRGKTTDAKPVPASSPSPSASERSAAEQKKIGKSEEPSSAHVHANVATRGSQWTSRLQTLRAVAYGEQGPGKRAGSRFRLGSRRTDQPIVPRRDRRNPPRDPRRAAQRHPLQALTMPKLCNNLCNTRLQTDDWEHLRPLGLAMDDCPDSDQVDVVIGIDMLRWIICGPVIANPSSPVTTTLCASVDQGIDRTLRRFWEIEEIRIGSEGDPDMSEQEKSFRDSLSFDGSRYSVRLLKKSGEMNLFNNVELAQKRLGTVERRLAQDPVQREQYASIFQDYLKNGWAEKVNDEGKSGRTWYLPHHVVYQQGSEGEKARIVFDGSAKYQGTSLHDHLDAGPKVQMDLMRILLRFQRYRVALQSDIAKMYLQVGLHEDKRDFCRFLWRDRSCSGTLDIYRLTRVCFGLACSPYLAIQVVNSHLEAHRTLFPSVADKIRSCMYVDDLVVSRDFVAEAKLFVHQASDLFSRGGFHLTKWASNAPEALSDLPAEDCSSVDPSVLDPLGALTPFTAVTAALATGISWDDPLPPEHGSKRAYICLFTCMVVRAINLELVPDQTIDSFLRALRRFVARLGRLDTIQSDNFRTFHQAKGVEWIFITERAPWCRGGYWERLVQSVKTALKAPLGQCLVSPDELRTVLCEVEAFVNDCLLTFVGSDVQEETALTPAQFLIGRSLTAFPDRSNRASHGTLSSSLRHLLRRWSYQRKLVDAFWKRWQGEYVVTLSSQGKWKKLQEQPRVGDVVLVADSTTRLSPWSNRGFLHQARCWQGLQRSRPRQVSCADRFALWFCWNQPKLIDGLRPSDGSLMEISLVAHGLLSISTCVHGYCSGPRWMTQ